MECPRLSECWVRLARCLLRRVEIGSTVKDKIRLADQMALDLKQEPSALGLLEGSIFL